MANHHGKTFDTGNTRHARVMQQLVQYVARTGDESIWGDDPETTACDWAEYSTLKPSDMPPWWAAWCFEPEAAEQLRQQGIGVTLAKRSSGVMCGEIDTFAYHVSMGLKTAGWVRAQLRS